MPWGTALAVVGIGTSLYGAVRGSGASKGAGRAARDVAYANASDIIALSNANAGALMASAGVNAAAARTVSYANAEAIERATSRNMAMFAFGHAEEVRRHVIQEKMIGGEVQVRAAASGFLMDARGTTPRRMIEAIYAEGKKSRQFLQKKGALTLLTMGQQGKDDAALQRLQGDVSASAMLANAAIGAEVTRLEGALRAAASRREGDLAYKTGSSAGLSALLGGVGQAANIGYNMWLNS